MYFINNLLLVAASSILLLNIGTDGFSTKYRTSSIISASTRTAPPRTDRKTGEKTKKNKKGMEDWSSPVPVEAGKLEYLADDMSISRLDDDPFHIILLGETFSEDRPRTTIPYVASSLEYVLGMPVNTALDHSSFAKENGMSCLGTWKREECLVLGSQLLVRDVVCRVVPFCDGGGGSGSGWQAKDVSNNNFSDVGSSSFDSFQ